MELKDLHRTQLSEKFFKNNHYDLYIIINEKYNDLEWKEKLYLYFNNLNKPPKCPICGNKCKFNSVFKGYYNYCSVQCSGKSQKRIDNIHNTLYEKYGVCHALQKNEFLEKSKQTNLKRYGCENASSSIEIRNKVKNTMLLKYGGMGNESNIIKQKYKETFRNNRLKNNTIPDQIGYDDNGDWIIKCNKGCENCDGIFIINPQVYCDRKRLNLQLCTKLNPVDQKNIKNTSLELFVKNILDEYGIQYESNNRTILNGKELDIYIPSKQMAIECNGIYWHSFKDPSYHINKYIKCEELGIQLITLWEDWIKIKPEIVKSIILSKLGIYGTRIYARKCIIKEIGSKECNIFLNKNHIQGASKSTLRFGLFYNDNLISIMTFLKKNNEYELVRFCNELNTIIIGGASKLLNHFINNYKPLKIISYSSNDISNGNLYKKLGFIYNGLSKPYWYINWNTFERYHRSNFSKQKLKDKGYNIENQTENEIMKQLPFWKIYDSGIYKWVFEIKKEP